MTNTDYGDTSLPNEAGHVDAQTDAKQCGKKAKGTRYLGDGVPEIELTFEDEKEKLKIIVKRQPAKEKIKNQRILLPLIVGTVASILAMIIMNEWRG